MGQARRPKCQLGRPAANNAKVLSPPPVLETEEQEEGAFVQTVGWKQSAIMGREGYAWTNTAPRVMVVGESLAGRVEKHFQPDETHIAPVVPVISIT